MENITITVEETNETVNISTSTEDVTVQIDEVTEDVTILEGSEVKAWINYVTEYEPSTETSVGGGIVIEMTNSNGTVYRFIPEPYDYNEDKFYSNFDGTNLTNLLTKRI